MAGPAPERWAFAAEGGDVEGRFAAVVSALEAAKQHSLTSMQRVSRCLAASENACAELTARCSAVEQEAALATGQLAAVSRRCDDLLEESALFAVERDRERIQLRSQIEQERAETRRCVGVPLPTILGLTPNPVPLRNSRPCAPPSTTSAAAW